MTVSSTTSAVEDLSIEVAGCKTHYMKAGSGTPLLILHQDIGNSGWLPIHDRLAEKFTVYAPDLLGWGGSERANWMRSVRDMASAMQSFTDKLGLDNFVLVGLGFGGWVAAEMAAMDQRRLKALVLVGAAGVQPPDGEIVDQFLHAYDDYVKQGFSDARHYVELYEENPPTETLMAWDLHREMVARIAWKPYMFSQTLPYLLHDFGKPASIVHGSEDRIVPVSCARRYAESIPGSKLNVLQGAGHYVEVERPDELAKLIAAAAG
jgi:pimeloyl-ACP methyl ester carboxylesterase